MSDLTAVERDNIELGRRLEEAADHIAALEAALKLARAYLDVSLGSPSWDGPNPYPIIDAALAPEPDK